MQFFDVPGWDWLLSRDVKRLCESQAGTWRQPLLPYWKALLSPR